MLVTSINPTPAGEGKTTVTVGLGQALNQLGKSAIIALREPSLGPLFWSLKGRSGWRWIFTSCTDGRSQSSFYR